MRDDLGFHVPLGTWCERANERIAELESENKRLLEQADNLDDMIEQAEAVVARLNKALRLEWDVSANFDYPEVEKEFQGWLADLKARAEEGSE